jgi:fructose-bisphosphate aldolase class II
MAMVNMRDLIHHAYENRYAVCSFEVTGIDMVGGLLDAAEQCRSPVILTISETCLGLPDIEIIMAAVERAAQRTQVPVALQFDQVTGEEGLCRGIRVGCNGIMFDTALETLPVNIQKTREIAELAHSCGIALEGKLGYSAHDAGQDDTGHTESETFTHASEARAFVERTGVDFLAVTIGGGNSTRKARTRLDFQRLAKINQTIDIPLVIHEDHELSDDQHFKLISHGVAKIDYAAVLFDSNGERSRATGKSSQGENSAAIRKSAEKKGLQYMHLCGSAGRAAEVMMQCRPWTNVEHVIIYNTTLTRDADIQHMISKGIELLSQIPGVREVNAGRSIVPDSKFAYTWLIKFCSPDVVEYYKNHPTHKHYADNEFRPNAGERITTDFEILNFNNGPHVDQVIYRATG